MGPTLRLGWQRPDRLIDEAVEAATGCDAAIVLVNAACGEGMDRDSLALPGDQDKLVRLVAAANPRTVVVLNTPGAVLMPWLDDVAAALQVWYPGERFGAALARVLFGDAEPGGRLPLTFPRSRTDLPGGDHGPDTTPTELDYDSDGGIGYRSPGVREHGARVALGHGLGYTRTDCEVTSVEASGDQLRLHLRIRNLGDRVTVHVAQCYASVGGEPDELVHVQRVTVPAGESVDAVATIGVEAFARWNGESARRVPVDGSHRLSVAISSVDPGTPIGVTITHGDIQLESLGRT
jgi:beta-glucosidase